MRRIKTWVELTPAEQIRRGSRISGFFAIVAALEAIAIYALVLTR